MTARLATTLALVLAACAGTLHPTVAIVIPHNPQKTPA